MEKLIEKIGSFHLLTNLVPGTVFCFLINQFTEFSAPVGDTIPDFIAFYFIGVVISRFGSIIIEPICKTLRIVKYAPHSQYLTAEKIDAKIIMLTEANDLYRSLLSSVILFFAMLIYEIAGSRFPFLFIIKVPALCIALIVLFTLSYRKQTDLVRKRVEHACQTET